MGFKIISNSFEIELENSKLNKLKTDFCIEFLNFANLKKIGKTYVEEIIKNLFIEKIRFIEILEIVENWEFDVAELIKRIIFFSEKEKKCLN